MCRLSQNRYRRGWRSVFARDERNESRLVRGCQSPHRGAPLWSCSLDSEFCPWRAPGTVGDGPTASAPHVVSMPCCHGVRAVMTSESALGCCCGVLERPTTEVVRALQRQPRVNHGDGLSPGSRDLGRYWPTLEANGNRGLSSSRGTETAQAPQTAPVAAATAPDESVSLGGVA